MVGIRTKRFSFQQCQPQCRNKVAVSDHSYHLHRVYFPVFIFPPEHIFFKAISLQVVGYLHTQRHTLHIRIFKYLLLETVCSPAPVQNIDLNQMFLIQSQIGILQIMELLEYDSRTNNHGYRDYEL